MTIRLAVQLHPQHASYDDLRRAVGTAEELGLDAVYNWDHFYPLYGDPDGRHFEAWTMLGAWAEQTDRIDIGCLVTCNSYRNPELLADMARTVDHISGGRLVFGIGSGWFERDYTEYGYEFGTAIGRLRKLGDDLPRLKARLAQLNPAPIGDLPILVGGSGEKVTLRLTAQHADAWNSFGPPETFAHKNSVLDNWCAEIGRDPSEIERTVAISPEDVGNLDAFLEAGATHLIVMTGHPYDLTAVEQLIARRDA
jgi:probable F420-dependent oxidoreductase